MGRIPALSLYHLDWSDDAVMSPFPSVAFDWNTKSETPTITHSVALPAVGEPCDTQINIDTDIEIGRAHV